MLSYLVFEVDQIMVGIDIYYFQMTALPLYSVAVVNGVS